MGFLYSVEFLTGTPTLVDAAAQLHLPVSALDPEFGVVALDPARHLFAVQATSEPAAAPASSDPYHGPYANPRIETFGPVRGR